MICSAEPCFSQRAALFHALLLAKYKPVEKRTDQEVLNPNLLDFEPNESHLYISAGFQEQLHSVMKSAHRDQALRIRIRSDESSTQGRHCYLMWRM